MVIVRLGCIGLKKKTNKHQNEKGEKKGMIEK
jgi:hypothetical protein